jgi:hypothetical protein
LTRQLLISTLHSGYNDRPSLGVSQDELTLVAGGDYFATSFSNVMPVSSPDTSATKPASLIEAGGLRLTCRLLVTPDSVKTF